MCGTCGCGQDDGVRIRKPGEHDHGHHDHEHGHDGDHHHHGHHDHHHEHGHAHDHTHTHPGQGREIIVEQDVLQKNKLLAERNRGFFEARNIRAVNMVSSPGSGKTSILEKTVIALKKTTPIYIIEGDQQTMNDAERIQATGAPVVQVNTGSGCHLDASMVNNAVRELGIESNAVLVIENVGNLVCPAMFDLGESQRVVIFSVTEGDDKPLKYPDMFRTSDVCIINKTDLLPYVDFDMEKARANALRVNHHLRFFECSARSGEGMQEWFDWLAQS